MWNWPQFLLDAVALLTASDGTSPGTGWPYGAMVVTLLLSFCRVAGVVGVLADRAGPAGRTSPPSLSFGCVLLAALAVVGVRYYDEPGAADVTGRTTVTPRGPLRDGERLSVTSGTIRRGTVGGWCRSSRTPSRARSPACRSPPTT